MRSQGTRTIPDIEVENPLKEKKARKQHSLMESLLTRQMGGNHHPPQFAPADFIQPIWYSDSDHNIPLVLLDLKISLFY